MTAVEWLIEQIKNDQNQKAFSASEWMKVIEQAKEMEKEQMTSYIVTTNYEANVDLSELNQYSLIPKISDEEIGKAIHKYNITDFGQMAAFQVGAKWYREQLKQRQ